MTVDPNIKNKAQKIRTEIYGKDVRESLASGLEGMSEDVESIKGRQDTVEETFQTVIDETTRKDVISAPEILDARQGSATLGQNLLSMKQDLAQTGGRIDTIIALPEGATANDARLEDIAVGADGTVHDNPGKHVRSISERLNKAEYPVENILKRDGGSAWSPINGGAPSLSGDVLTVTSNGSSAYPAIQKTFTPVSGNRYYYRVVVRVTNSDCTGLSLRDNSAVVASVSTVVADQEYIFEGIYNFVNGAFRIQMNYPSTTVANGKKMVIHSETLINLDAALPTPVSLSQIQELLKPFPNNSFKGRANVFSATYVLEKILSGGAGGGGTPYDQSLNTFDTVTFANLHVGSLTADNLNLETQLPKGTIATPPAGLTSGDMWLDTTDSSTHPIVRMMA